MSREETKLSQKHGVVYVYDCPPLLTKAVCSFSSIFWHFGLSTMRLKVAQKPVKFEESVLDSARIFMKLFKPIQKTAKPKVETIP